MCRISTIPKEFIENAASSGEIFLPRLVLYLRVIFPHPAHHASIIMCIHVLAVPFAPSSSKSFGWLCVLVGGVGPSLSPPVVACPLQRTVPVSQAHARHTRGHRHAHAARAGCVCADALTRGLCCRLVSRLGSDPFFRPSVRHDACCSSRTVGPCGLRWGAGRRVGERCMRWKGLRRERSAPAAHARTRKGQACWLRRRAPC